MFDLLNQDGTGDLVIQDDPRSGVCVKGLTQQICTSEEEALNCLFEGETNRTIASHQMNKNSSRSHCVFTLYTECRSRVESQEKII